MNYLLSHEMKINNSIDEFIIYKSSKSCSTRKPYKNYTRFSTPKTKLSNKSKVTSSPSSTTVSQYSKPPMPSQIYSTSMYLPSHKLAPYQPTKNHRLILTHRKLQILRHQATPFRRHHLKHLHCHHWSLLKKDDRRYDHWHETIKSISHSIIQYSKLKIDALFEE